MEQDNSWVGSLVLASCCAVGRYWYFEGTYCLHLWCCRIRQHVWKVIIHLQDCMVSDPKDF